MTAKWKIFKCPWIKLQNRRQHYASCGWTLQNCWG